MKSITVSELFYYPVKSCAGTRLLVGDVGNRGFKNDRIFMLTDLSGDFLTQREYPKMALIKPVLQNEHLHLSAPGMADLKIPVRHSGAVVNVVVWDDSCRATDQGDEAAQWFSDYMEFENRLVIMEKSFTRYVDKERAVSPNDQVGFADGYPFLIISQASLDDLNSRLQNPLPMNRFRPNIVVSGCDAYAEDTWRQIKIGPVTFEIVKSCARCVVTTTDQNTLQKSKEPLATLAAYRTGRSGGVLFGQNMVHHNTGVIHQGDTVEILKFK